MSIFDKLAKKWDLKPRRVESAKKFVDRLGDVVDLRDKRVIDYGCGTGLVSFLLLDRVKEVLALDNSKGMLEELNKKIELSQLRDIKAQKHDISKESLPCGYDLFVTSMTLHHIKDIDDFISKAKASLNSGGHIAISDLVSEDGTFHSRGNDGVYHFGFDLDNLAKRFNKAGVEVIFNDEIYSIKKDKEYPIFMIVGRV